MPDQLDCVLGAVAPRMWLRECATGDHQLTHSPLASPEGVPPLKSRNNEFWVTGTVGVCGVTVCKAVSFLGENNQPEFNPL